MNQTNVIKPTFIGIGAQRSGTTWLHKQLQTHDDIWLPPVKEIHFFDRCLRYPSPNDLSTSSLWRRLKGVNAWERPRILIGIKKVFKCLIRRDQKKLNWFLRYYFGYYDTDWYSGLFKEGRQFISRGEITPSYAIIDDEDILSMKSVNPDMKLIMLLRNPIDRAWSAIQFFSNYPGVEFNIRDESIVGDRLKSREFMLRGDYIRTINKYLNYFKPNQLLICFYDAIYEQPTLLLNDIFRHLGVPEVHVHSQKMGKKVNASFEYNMPESIKNVLLEIYAAQIEVLSKSLGSYALRWNNPAFFNTGIPSPTVQVIDKIHENDAN